MVPPYQQSRSIHKCILQTIKCVFVCNKLKATLINIGFIDQCPLKLSTEMWTLIQSTDFSVIEVHDYDSFMSVVN